MPPRLRPAPAPDTFHATFDPGVTGRRTGVAVRSDVRRLSNGVERMTDYFASPRKDPSVSPPQHTPVQMSGPKRARNDRPDKFHDIGERGRKTGISPPVNVAKDKNGFEEFDAYLVKATEQTNKDIQRERRRSTRKSDAYKRKLSAATFVDDGDDDDDDDVDMDLMDESMSLDTTQELNAIRDRGGHVYNQLSDQNHRSSRRPQKRRSGSTGSADRSTRTLNDSELVDFDAVPEGLPRAPARYRSLEADDQPINVGDAHDDHGNHHAQDAHGGGPTDGEQSGNDGDHNSDNEAEFPNALEDITEEDEDQDMEAPQALGSQQASLPRPAKRRKSNPRPPPIAGTRRSARTRVSPLRHWKNERVIYGRSMTPDGTQRVIGMLDVVRFPKEEAPPLALRRYGRKASAKVKSESLQPPEGPAPEEGWDSETRPNGIVYSFTKNKDCERKIVQTKRMVEIDVEDRAGVPDSFQFQRVCKDADYVAGGLMFIPVGGGKPLKPAKDNFYIFTVLEGAVSVHIHRTTFVVAPMGIFWVPRGNAYSIQNISQRTAKLTFAQARRATGEEPVAGSDEDEERSYQSTPSTSKADRKGKKKATSRMSGDDEQDGEAEEG